MTMPDDAIPTIPLTDAQRTRFEAAADRALTERRRQLRQRRSISKGRRGRFVWHIYRPTQPTVFGSYTFKPDRFSFSLRWVIGWVMW